MEEISKFVNEFMLKFINNYSKKIAEELLDNDQDKLEKIINMGKDLLNLPKIEKDQGVFLKTEKDPSVFPKITENTISPQTTENKNICIHKWTRGKHVPGSLCGAKTVEGSFYCRLHKKTANKTSTEIKNSTSLISKDLSSPTFKYTIFFSAKAPLPIVSDLLL